MVAVTRSFVISVTSTDKIKMKRSYGKRNNKCAYSFVKSCTKTWVSKGIVLGKLQARLAQSESVEDKETEHYFWGHHLDKPFVKNKTCKKHQNTASLRSKHKNAFCVFSWTERKKKNVNTLRKKKRKPTKQYLNV